MKSNLLLFFSFPFFLFFLSGCNDSSTIDFELTTTNSPFDFHSIIKHKSTLYATGGDIWNKSYMLTSANGINWSIDSLTNKSLFDLYSNNQTLYGVGNDGYIFSGNPDLKLTRTEHWGMLRAFTESSDGFVAAGGKDFNKGWIYKVNSELKVDTTHLFPNEILDINCNRTNQCIACGYGIILTSVNSGTAWKRSSENGDYYNSIARNNNDDIFIVGYNGTIIKSTDQGVSWDKLKNGHSPLANNKPFRAIKFHDSTGIIVGDNGLVWISIDDGNIWNDISIKTDLDLFDFEFMDSKIIAVSEKGKILSIEI